MSDKSTQRKPPKCGNPACLHRGWDVKWDEELKRLLCSDCWARSNPKTGTINVGPDRDFDAVMRG